MKTGDTVWFHVFIDTWVPAVVVEHVQPNGTVWEVRLADERRRLATREDLHTEEEHATHVLLC